MRVITGSARGIRLETVSGTDLVRPTPDRVKEGIFSALQFDIEGRRILDLFAGSGQLGIEALSRGAENAVFVDLSNDALSVVRKNLTHAKLLEKARLVKSDFASFTANCRDLFDLAFLDPPFGADFFEKAVAAVGPLMSDYGTICCEHPTKVILPQTVDNFEIVRTYRYGSVSVDFYKKCGATNE